MHKHHIEPKHAGGTNHPENIKEVTIEEHAEEHRLLFLEHGRSKDYIAWKALSGQIGKEEIRKFLQRHAWVGKKHTEEAKQKNREKHLGKKLTDEHKRKIAELMKGRPSPLRGRKLPDSTKQKMRVARKDKPNKGHFKRGQIPWNKIMKEIENERME